MSDYSHLPVAYGSLPDVFAAELTAVEALGPCVRLVFTAPVQDGAEARRDRVACIVILTKALPNMVRQLSEKPRPIVKDQPEAALDEDSSFQRL
jgi:hypothetical protein